MILYLAGLKGVDPSLREAAALDGANNRQTFFRVVFPAMKPINIVVVVITVIEALRAFDIVFIINKGNNGLQLLSTMIYTNSGAAARVGYASALAVILLVIALVPIVSYLQPGLQGGEPVTRSRHRHVPHARGARHAIRRRAEPEAARRLRHRRSTRGSKASRIGITVFLAGAAALWLIPLAVDGLHLAAALRLLQGPLVLLDRWALQLPELRRRLGAGRAAEVLRQLADHHAAGGDPDAAAAPRWRRSSCPGCRGSGTSRC